MTTTLSPSDWQKCSDYFDRQMNAAERVNFEARLRTEPALRENLEDLRRLRIVLRSQPRIRVKKNFTLTPNMIGGKSPHSSWGMFQSLRLATALASVLLILVVAGDLLSNNLMRPPAVADSAVTFQAANAPVPADVAVPERPASGSREAAPPPSEIEAEIVILPTPEPGVMAKKALPTETSDIEMSLQMEAPTAEPTGEPAMEAFSLPVEGELAEVTSESTSTEESAMQAFSLPESDETTDQPSIVEPAKQPSSPQLAWRIAEGLLLAIVVGAGLAAFLLRRR